jgi:hypothetical protein
MRETLFAASVLATVLATSAAADGLAPKVDSGTVALQTVAGRASLCRAYLETRGYPYSYLYRTRRASWGVVRTCAAQLYRAHRMELHRT